MPRRARYFTLSCSTWITVREDIEAQIEEMVAKDLLTPQQAQSVDAARIRRFLNSPLGKRMLASKSIKP